MVSHGRSDQSRTGRPRVSTTALSSGPTCGFDFRFGAAGAAADFFPVARREGFRGRAVWSCCLPFDEASDRFGLLRYAGPVLFVLLIVIVLTFKI